MTFKYTGKYILVGLVYRDTLDSNVIAVAKAISSGQGKYLYHTGYIYV